MRKTALYVAGWFAAGIGAVSLATAGVSMVGRQVTGERPSSLSAQEVRAELGRDGTEPDTSTTAPSSPSTSTPTPTAPGAGPGTDGGTAGDDSSGGGGAPAPTGVGPTAPTPGTAGPDDGGDDSDDDAPVTTSTAPAPSETRTYSMTGGTATLRFSSDGVTVVVATPNAGFSVDQEPTHDNGVRVEFRNDEHRSRVEGWWDGGPRDEVEEED